MAAEVSLISIIVFAAGLGFILRGNDKKISRNFKVLFERLERIDERIANVESLCVEQERQHDFDNRLTRVVPPGKQE